MTTGQGLGVEITLVIFGQDASEVPLRHLSGDIMQAVGYVGLELVGWTACRLEAERVNVKVIRI